MMPRLPLLTSLAAAFCFGFCSCDGKPPEESSAEPQGSQEVQTPPSTTALLADVGDFDLVARFRDRDNRPLPPPETIAKACAGTPADISDAIRVEFRADSIAGFGDKVNPVFCVLVDVREEDSSYGIYALWNAKANLVMPLPGSERSIAPEDSDAEQAIRGMVSAGLGLSEERASEIVTRFRHLWLAPGLRAFLFTKIPIENRSAPTLHWYECLADTE